MTSEPKRKLVVITGTNASGKSMLGVELARHFGGEVISADSRQVYRHLDIGTGKLTSDEMRGVPHHLIDVADIGDRFSVADFQAMAYALTDEISERGRLPFIVGGTGLYVRSVVEGYQLISVPPDWDRRNALEALTDEQLRERLSGLDDTALERVSGDNRRRMIRAIEILDSGFAYPPDRPNEPRYNVLQLGLTWPTEVLRRRVDQRLKDRLAAGMVDEVKAILDKGHSADELDSLGLEYRHIVRLIRGEYQSEDELYENLRRAIYRFSRQQMVWFRRDTAIHWLDCEQNYFDEARGLIESFIGSPSAQ
ncbi:tRNA (adenosine(37)-N6)-dimethylallyltransferase MiaA [Pseudofrankia sp. BMG5.36]|uniref:tRNA (adenosine(37)-N6)-dimethylallyltransferase MiaA n=1 Tax=Pseudofrankia sp. BMG5.36 TaxID=1834512 RepID=UPI000A8E8F7B|nr:tRNA (adenosine(37)-N6)-dimethylallyltransferase MiaA [Pseudofrankia sp. BMG5.36]